ncbi:hypothetical protein [Ancylobacter defluvii]|uniref:Uncharacterized protein n=1 Tax=Ancylobacter defluvii TaxID=1282440 RepID=A0A9W6K0D0_9HYPH|nr:hypothetical protein [Ancylobacter defluvii]MBS7587112.1 hypothetical protein [Ancylobacter defluvii]GLK85415.1 hypothetical protein GCM10017653_34850 [Ancylobacter defluvii]
MPNPFRAALLVLGLSLAGAGAASAATKPVAAAADPLVGRVWVETRPASDLPGTMLVFLPDGTLLMDSCWETYALRKWSRTAPDAIAWDEDGARLTAKVQSVSPTQLTLKVQAGKDVVEHRYSLAKVPYVCPDMKR